MLEVTSYPGALSEEHSDLLRPQTAFRGSAATRPGSCAASADWTRNKTSPHPDFLCAEPVCDPTTCSVPVQVTKEGLHLFQTVLAVGPKGADLLPLFLQPGAEFRELLRRNLLAGPLDLILDLVQTSLGVLGFQEALMDMKQTTRTHQSCMGPQQIRPVS